MPAKKFYTIGEVGDFLGIPTSTLRYWEQQFKILAPTRGMTGRRRYTEKDIENVRKIHYLIKERGMKIEAAREELKKNPRGVDNTYRAIERLRTLKSKLQQLIEAMDRLR